MSSAKSSPRPGLFTLAVVSGALLGGASAAQAQVQVNAGADFATSSGTPVAMQGVVNNVSPLDFWTADGDGAAEDKLIKSSSVSGRTDVGPLKSPSGQVYGWPSDYERIGGVVYGIETFHKFVYTLNADTGVCTPLANNTGYTRVFGLAYDAPHDKLYAVDQKTRGPQTFVWVA